MRPTRFSCLRLGQSSYRSGHRGRALTGTALVKSSSTLLTGGTETLSEEGGLGNWDRNDSMVGAEAAASVRSFQSLIVREKRKFPVVSSAGWYGIRERVGTAGSSGGGMEDWPVLGVDGYAAMVKFVEIGQPCIPASMLEIHLLRSPTSDLHALLVLACPESSLTAVTKIG